MLVTNALVECLCDNLSTEGSFHDFNVFPVGSAGQPTVCLRSPKPFYMKTVVSMYCPVLSLLSQNTIIFSFLCPIILLRELPLFLIYV